MDERCGREAAAGDMAAEGWWLKKKKKSGHGVVDLGYGFRFFRIRG